MAMTLIARRILSLSVQGGWAKHALKIRFRLTILRWQYVV